MVPMNLLDDHCWVLCVKNLSVGAFHSEVLVRFTGCWNLGPFNFGKIECVGYPCLWYTPSQPSNTKMSSSVSIDLQAALCADPVGGAIYRHLFNGGSWFEADQMHWRLQQEQALIKFKSAVGAKPTKPNQQKAQEALKELEECAKQLVPSTEPMALFQRADQVVKTWAPKVAPKAAETKPKTANAFSALDDSEEEE